MLCIEDTLLNVTSDLDNANTDKMIKIKFMKVIGKKKMRE